MVLDTDTISYYLRGDENIKHKMLQHQYELGSTTVNYAELVFGLKKRDAKKYLPIVEQIFDNIQVYDFDKRSARTYASLKVDMQSRGVVVADMDLMIASIALVNGQKVITDNLKHFSKIVGLELESWVG